MGGGDLNAPATVDADLRAYRATGDRVLRNRIIEAHRGLAVSLARRFEHRGEPLDDLIQVAQVGILKAVERYDPERGTPFVGFASPTVLGELRRHFRDATWSLKVPRDAKDLSVRVSGAVEQLSADLGRSPSMPELAARLGVSVDELLIALAAGSAYRASSLDAPARNHERDGSPLVAAMGGLDPGMGLAEAAVTVETLLAHLPERERQIVSLRFFGDMTQAEIASQIGISQMHVSRLLRRALEHMGALADPPV